MSQNENSVFDDIMQGLAAVEEHQKDNIQLKSAFISIPDDDISIKFNKLPEKSKQAIRIIIDEMLAATNH